MRRKRSQSPLTPGGAVSPHRTTRASSRSPRILGPKAIISPSQESQHSVNCESSGHLNGGSHSRHGSGSPNKLSTHEVDNEMGSTFRRSSRVSKSLAYHENDSEEEINKDTGIESRSRSLRKGGGKRENNDSGSTRNKRFKNERQRNNPDTSNHSFITTDEEEEIGGRESPFLNHVRFSPSAKLGSPARSRDLRQHTPGSKTIVSSRQRVSRAAADIARIRLQNVPSEDEQYEFNRRYSRDLRQRKGAARKKLSAEENDSLGNDDTISPTRKTRMSPRRAQGGTSPISINFCETRRNRRSGEIDESNNASEDETHNETKEDIEEMAKSFLQEVVSSVGKPRRKKANNEHREEAEEADDESQQSEEDQKEPKKHARTILRNTKENESKTVGNANDLPIRRSTRRQVSVNYSSKRERDHSVSDDDKTEIHEEVTPLRNTRRKDKKIENDPAEQNHDQWVRRSSRRTKSFSPHTPEFDACLSDATHQSAETGVRRSKREHHKPSFYDPVAYEKHHSSSDEEEEEEEDDEEEEEVDDEDKPISRSQRRKSKRRRRSVERFAYEASEPNRRRSNREHRRSQYSSDEEFRRGRDNNRRRRREDRRRRPTNMNRMKDTSSSSSEDEIEKRDEASFQKRKNKRMNIERSKLMPLNFGKKDVTEAIFRERSKAGSSMADISPMEIDMNVTFESIGGLSDHVDKLREMVMFPLLYPEFFKKYNTNPPKGVLFYGPPGTGKTMMARALACECSQENRKVAFFMRKGADCLSKWIGESERQLRLLFDQAYQMRPSIIFFDEIDGLAPVRSSRQDQIHSSIVSTLLALMDGLDDRGEIIIIGATNRIENIDPALRRPGRFDRELRFSLPTQAARKDILTLTTKNWNPPISSQLIEHLSEKTIGYCGADLKGLCAEAPLNALRRRYPHVYKTNQKLALNLDDIVLTEEDFFKAMKSMVPSTHRITDQNQAPLTPEIKPLLQSTVTSICQSIEKIMPKRNYGSSSEEKLGSYYRPRLLIKGNPEQGLTTYVGPAILHAFETLPCHKLDITSLFSNAARSPEEALFHIIHEARRTVPSILYIPHFMKLWRNVMTGIHATLREALISLLSDIPPTAPLLILAIAEELENEDEEDAFLALKLFNNVNQVLSVPNPTEIERENYFKPIFDAARRPPPEIKEVQNPYDTESLLIVPIADTRKLTEKEEKRLRRKEDALMRELRIFLRDIHHKINKEPKFFMFRVPVDTEEVYDYLDIIENPMDFETMQTKIDKEEYYCAQDYLDDIDLIAKNAIKYNDDLSYETNKIISHRAKSLQDFCYALVKGEMDTDFEDDCQQTVERRKKLTKELQTPEKDIEKEKKYFSLNHQSAVEANQAQKLNTNQKAPIKKRHSSTFGKRAKRIKRIPVHESNFQNESKKDVTIIDNQCEDINEGVDSESSKDSLTFQIDERRLTTTQQELTQQTHGLAVEDLGRIFCQLMEIVSQFRNRKNRSEMIRMIQDYLSSLNKEPSKMNEIINTAIARSISINS